MFYPIDVHHHLKGDLKIFNCDNENATLLNRECFILPSYPELNTAEQKHIIDVTNEYVKEII